MAGLRGRAPAVAEEECPRSRHDGRQQANGQGERKIGVRDAESSRLRGIRRHDAAAVALLELLDAAGVIVMMVGHQNVREPPALGLQRRLHRGRFRRIDCGGCAAFGIVEKDAEIVLEAEEELGLGGHGLSF